MALIVYAITLFASAFLLFLVQPIIGQKILPKLGGTPSVWNTCVVFFQLTLLAGYAYTHFASKLPVRRQIMLHCGLLLLPFLILLPWGPFPVEGFQPVSGGNPMLPTLGLLAMIVGIPFFVVSTTAPLLQKWFGSTGHPASKDPYFLYGASNLGSMLSLLLYPPVFEPLLGLEGQSWFYTIGYLVLVGMVVSCGVMAFQAMPSLVQLAGPKTEPAADPVSPPATTEAAPPSPDAGAAPAPVPSAEQITSPPAAPAPPAVTSSPPSAPPAPARPSPATAIKKGGKKGKGKGKDLAKFGGVSSAAVATPAVAAAVASATATAKIAPHKFTDADDITWPRRLRWIGLAAVPSSLMLGVTMYMSTDISAIPLFWVMPLALYLFSFILVFMRWPINWLEDAHTYVLYAQPILLVLLAVFMAISSASVVVYLIGFMLLAYLATALACHGEMAKDRPSTKHLTEFYLMMSVGGALGGLFNCIIAPVIFEKFGIVEFPLALFLAGILRPTMSDMGWTEMLIAGMSSPPEAGGRGGKQRRGVRTSAEMRGMTTVLDFALPLVVLGLLVFMLNVIFRPGRDDFMQNMFFAVAIPAICTACYFARPIRFGLALGAILLVTGLYTQSSVVFQTRSYFGVLRVQRSYEAYGTRSVPYINLMHGTTNHGMALQRAEDPSIPDLTRVATTYYHRKGPVGICMERFNWFSGTPTGNDKEGFTEFSSDARVLASLVGNAAPGLGNGLGAVVTYWSEPAFATIGLGTGTMVSYAHPLQPMHFYEIDEQIRRLSLPEPGGTTYFGYLQAAKKRGAKLDVLMGDARLRMAMPWIPKEYKDQYDKDSDWQKIPFDKRGGPEHFYHLMVVDAFSSDAIPRHLITKEAMAMYFKHLVQGHWVDLDKETDPERKNKENPMYKDFVKHDTENKIWVPGGVLCVHTSNRHLKLVPVVRDTAATVEWDDLYDRDADGKPKKKTGLVAVRGHDNAPGHQGLKIPNDIGHFTSEWVMVARDRNDLKHLNAPPKYDEWISKANAELPDNKKFRVESYWQDQTPRGEYVWTDDHSNLMAVFNWPWAAH